ncbi:hypothetical protein GA0070606_5668 [Micromonospora citrea]|uniref:Uncharacterized protein n=1 Tax=Micromonospora citrea TaxID=47855 RepID=A0A1C6VY68_9ACTN|nr:hypothetical protein [Micromonospora citrea]SCL71268.1 hypothetical protein GA0070606_5668 [Micromonospora citrea]
MSRLEERYRLVLRLLPAAYRRQWEEDMVAAFLDSVDTGDPETTDDLAEFGRPSLSEVASVLSLAVRLRLGGADAPPRSYAWGQAVRLATLTAMLTQAVTVTASIAVALWLSGKVDWLPAPAAELALAPPRDAWHTAWNLAGYAWLPAYVALVLGHRRVARAVALLAVVPPAVTTAVEQAAGAAPPTVSPWAMRLVDVVLLLAMAAFHHDAPPVRPRPWLLALPIGILLVPVPLFVAQATTPALRLLDWPGLACAVVTAAMAVHLALRVPVRRSRTLPWSLALTLLAVATLALRAVTLPDHGAQAQGGILTTIAAVQAVAVLAVGAPVAALAVRALRRLPPVAAAPAPDPGDPSVGVP